MRPAKLREEGALAKIADGLVGRASSVDLPADVGQSLPVVLRVLAGRAEPRELTTAMAPRPAPIDPAREELRRRMMALTVRPAPVAIPEPEPEPEPILVEAMVLAPAPEPDLSQEVADRVVKERSQDLDATIGLAAGTDSSHLLLRGSAPGPASRRAARTSRRSGDAGRVRHARSSATWSAAGSVPGCVEIQGRIEHLRHEGAARRVVTHQNASSPASHDGEIVMLDRATQRGQPLSLRW